MIIIRLGNVNSKELLFTASTLLVVRQEGQVLSVSASITEHLLSWDAA